MTPGQRRTVFAAALVLAIGGALAAPAVKVQGASSEGTVGEATAQSYHAQNRVRFAAHALLITPGQTAAAQAEGALDGPLASQPFPTGDGGEWTLPGRFVGPE